MASWTLSRLTGRCALGCAPRKPRKYVAVVFQAVRSSPGVRPAGTRVFFRGLPRTDSPADGIWITATAHFFLPNPAVHDGCWRWFMKTAGTRGSILVDHDSEGD